MKCGLLGKKLSHSYSPQIHSALGDYEYSLFEKEPEELEQFLRHGDFAGLNITIPYKKSAIPYCDELSPIAAKLGSVNTLVRRADETLIGHNTDYFGFQSMLKRSTLDVRGKKVLVLGSGGASVTATAVMAEMGATVVVISRSGQNNYANLHLHCDAVVIVNTTPVGMYPDVGNSPVDLNLFPALEGVLDVIYNPACTQLLLDAQARGLITQNGLWMLVAQAKESAEWFTQKAIPDDVIPEIHKALRRKMENTVLIGMPGCGKSTIGKLLAQQLGKTFVDADQQIEEAAGKTIPQIFSGSGEDGFRKIETQVLSELGKQSGLVIATGGGCVTKPENYPLLHQNGCIYWIKRDIDLLPTVGRPLSESCELSEMYRIRKPLYKRFSDRIIDNNANVADAVAAIVKTEEL